MSGRRLQLRRWGCADALRRAQKKRTGTIPAFDAACTKTEGSFRNCRMTSDLRKYEEMYPLILNEIRSQKEYFTLNPKFLPLVLLPAEFDSLPNSSYSRRNPTFLVMV